MRQRNDRCRFWTCLVGALALLALPAHAQRIIGEDENIQMTVGTAAGKTLAQAVTDGDLGAARFTKATLPFPGVDHSLVIVIDSLFPGDCGGNEFDLVTHAPLGAMTVISGPFETLCMWVPDAASPGFDRYVAQGPVRVATGLDDWSYPNLRSSRDLVVVPIFGIYPTLGGDSFEEQQTQFTADTPSGQADTTATLLGLTAFPAGCSEPSGESVLENCLPDVWDVELHRCSASPFAQCDEDSDCTSGTCGSITEAPFGNSCIAIRYVGATGPESVFDMHDIAFISNAVDSGTPGQLTIRPPLRRALTGTGSTTTGDGFEKCMNESYIHPSTMGGFTLGASLVTEVMESQWVRGGNLLTGGDFGTDCSSLGWSGGTLISSEFRTDLEIHLSQSAIGRGCHADNVDLGDTFLTSGFTTDPGGFWIEGTVFHSNQQFDMGSTFAIVDVTGTTVEGTTEWFYKTASGYVSMPGGVLPTGVCQAGCVIVFKTAGLLGSTSYRLLSTVTTAPTASLTYMLDEVHVAHTPIERQELGLTPVFALDNDAPSIVILGDSFANGGYADGVRTALELYAGICDVAATSTGLCDAQGRPRMDVNPFTARYSRPGARFESYDIGDGWGVLKDINPDYCIVLMGTNDETNAFTDGAVGFTAGLEIMAGGITGPTRFCGRVILPMTLPLRSTPAFIDCSDVDTDNDCFALKTNSGWNNFLNP